jgi:glycosyltransferase involved in cell wall biosynthesis
MNPLAPVTILHYAGPPIIGGVESTIAWHARLLTERDYPVHVIAGRGAVFDPRVTFIQLPEIDSRHPQVLAVGRQLAAGNQTAQFGELRDYLVEKLRPILAEVEVCIVHNVLTLHKNLALTAAIQNLQAEHTFRLIAWCHDFAWQDPLYTPNLHPGYPWDLLRTAWDGVQYVVVSESRRKDLADLLGLPVEQIQVVTPGIDVFEFLSISPLTRQILSGLDLAELNPLLLLPARITRRKNIEFAIRTTAALQAILPEASLLITGPPGPHNPKNQAYLQALIELADDLGIRAHVHFLYQFGEDGEPLNLPEEAVAELYRLADLMIFPSLREGFGIPILEAGLTRLPIFAADIPPVRETAGSAIQLFDPRGDPQEVATRISKFLEQDQAYGLKRRVMDEYSWEAIIRTKLIPLIEGR